jgi:hypothetical protein
MPNYERYFRYFFNDDMFDPATVMFKEEVYNNKTEQMELTERDNNCMLL